MAGEPGTVNAMTSSAAIFDLDRTLLAGASGPVISAAMRDVGVLSSGPVPGESALFKLFNLVGENRLSMRMAREGARFAKGWERDAVREAGRRAAPILAAEVQPYALATIAEHRDAGRPVVMATTTPFDVIEPLAEILGMDGVVATRYGVQKDGTYDGTIDGEFVWGPGKLRAVRSWAGANGVVVSQSWAYSDSWYDLPLLDAAANPTAVNPDPRLRAMAVALRWPITHFTAPQGVPRFGGIEPQTVAIPFLRPELFPYARFDIRGTDRIPARGPAIIVANHRSYFDPVAMALTTAKAGRPVRSLGKKEVVDAPLVGALVRAAGVIRVDRASGSDEPLRAAVTALRAGDMVSLMPQGTIPRGRAFFDPELKGRWGAARLAALSGAPVIPVGIWGTEKVWPRSSRLPDVLNLTDPPDIRVRVGHAVDLDLIDPDEDTRSIMAAIADLLPAEARRQHDPSPEELARTLPPGYEGDPDAELDRRPGTD